ncbi:hypothetical protein BpHYR1_027152 [Brachionus plicatilis]|uniref:Uncharacterized protein n=1 Tax=Brachionus plicatilis TaxID=10195 RepID=A0A3M7QFA9_BRAPC|nr:hypothetical protein BpHYR1_027152 [Brachionus plicatilis]
MATIMIAWNDSIKDLYRFPSVLTVNYTVLFHQPLVKQDFSTDIFIFHLKSHFSNSSKLLSMISLSFCGLIRSLFGLELILLARSSKSELDNFSDFYLNRTAKDSRELDHD